MVKVDEREMLRVWLTGELKEQTLKIASERSMTQTAMVTKLLDWFQSQPCIVQGAVLGQVKFGGWDELARIILQEVSKRNMPDTHLRPNAVAQSRTFEDSCCFPIPRIDLGNARVSFEGREWSQETGM